MPDKLLELEILTQSDNDLSLSSSLRDKSWKPILRHSCDFSPEIFESVSLNLIKNPNINSSLLFRADVLYDSFQDELTDLPIPEKERVTALQEFNVQYNELQEFAVTRTIIRRMIPRNPQLDKPIAQTCLLLNSITQIDGWKRYLVVYIPHCSEVDHLPWYHPRVKALAYLHAWPISDSDSAQRQGTISLYFKLFPTEQWPLSERLMRTGQHLLCTIHKHGQGKLAGYQKRVHHDQIISQQRVQDTYTDLKKRHAKRLCDNWIEQTEPSKHVFEDLGIAAFLMELWRDMYKLPAQLVPKGGSMQENLPEFPGFVDIGCGNGVLVDVLNREGYDGWGFDARKRKTWSTFSGEIQSHLQERILIPHPFFEQDGDSKDSLGRADAGLLSHWGRNPWHNGIFPIGTFIISNHADELTPWTPLLASISDSPFLAIPCCSHNLSGLRFRAPSIFNNYSADFQAPSYFAANINRSKSVAIAVSRPDNNYGMHKDDEGSAVSDHASGDMEKAHASEQGDLKNLSASSRAKQPSAYSSLCDWVAHLSSQVGYKVETEVLRMPSTRNMGLICRHRTEEAKGRTPAASMTLILDILRKEKASGTAWVGRAKGLVSGQASSTQH